MTPSHFGRAKKRLDCAARPIRFHSWIDPKRLSAPATRPAAKLGEPWARKGNGSGRVFRRTVHLLGTRCFIGSARVAIAWRRGGVPWRRGVSYQEVRAKRCASPRVGKAAVWTAVYLFSDHGTSQRMAKGAAWQKLRPKGPYCLQGRDGRGWVLAKSRIGRAVTPRAPWGKRTEANRTR